MDARVDLDQMVTMRDGIGLATDIYRPDDDGPHPVLVHRSPYTKSAPTAVIDVMTAVRAGYVVVMQECRGRLGSEGDFSPFHHESDDGFDTIEWAAAQRWSTGDVAIFGSSGNGYTAVQAAIADPPHLRCVVAVHTGFDLHAGWVYANGALELAFIHGWVRRFAPSVLAKADLDDDARRTLGQVLEAWMDDPQGAIRQLPLDAAFPEPLSPFFFEWLAHAAYDDYWAEIDAVAQAHQISVPVLHLTGWYDGFLLGHLDFQRRLQEHPDAHVRDESRLIVGPWDHHSYLSPTRSSWSGDRDFGAKALSGLGFSTPVVMTWFQRWLRNDRSADTGPAVRYYQMGERRWQDATQWPPSDAAPLELHLSSEGRANSSSGDGRLTADRTDASTAADSYTYDPANPVPTWGGRHLGLEFAPSGVQDQSAIEGRDDVLVYTGETLTDAIVVAGRIEVRLFARTTAPDTDFCAKLVDVEPDGYAAIIAEGLVRARYRDGRDRPSDVEPGAVVAYTIDAWDTAHTFEPGHRIRLEITSSNFPRHDRNLNQSISAAPGELPAIAVQTILHDPQHPSRLFLPVV